MNSKCFTLNSFLFRLSIKELFRSPDYSERMGGKIVLGILSIFVSIGLVYLGLFIGSFVKGNAFELINSFLLDFFILDFITKLILLRTVSFNFAPFRLLPIKKCQFASFYLVSSIPNWFNIYSLTFFITFFFAFVLKNQPLSMALQWLLTVFALIFSSHFLAIAIKLQIRSYKTFKYYLLGLFLLICSYVGWRLSNSWNPVQILSTYLTTNLIGCFIPVIILIGTIFYAKFAFVNCFYISKPNKLGIIKIAFGNKLFRFRNIHLKKAISLELLLIFRNRKPRKVIYSFLFTIGYSFYFYRKISMDSDLTLILIGVLVLFTPVYMYGQFFPSFHGKYFPLIMVTKMKINSFLKSIYIFLSAISVVVYILTIPFVYQNTQAILINSMLVLYNIGVNNYITIYWGTNNKKSIELNDTLKFSANGIKTNEIVLLLLVIFVPIILYIVFSLFFTKIVCILILGGIGVVGIVFNKKLIQIIQIRYNSKKYEMLRNFRLHK